MEITNFKKKKIKPFTNEQHISYQNAKICYICKEKFQDKHVKYRNNCKSRDHCHYTGEYRGATHSMHNLKYSALKKFSIVFHNGSNYDYHFTIKKLAEEFEKQLLFSVENTAMYIPFSAPIEEDVTRIDNKRQ